MSKTPQIPPLARDIERSLFGALLGMVAAAVVSRVALLAYDASLVVIIGLLLIGGFSGGFITHYLRESADTVVQSFRDWNTRLRRVCLTFMLWMLGLAAIIGVLTVLTASYDILGRVAGTVVATGIVAGVLWPLSMMADGENTQSAGLLGMFATILVYLLVIPLIWDLDRHDEKMFASSMVIGLTVPFGMTFLSLTNFPVTWISARFGVGVFITVLVCFLIAVWHPGGWRYANNWWETGWWTAAYGSLSFAAITGLQAFTISWRWLGLAANALAWILVMIGVWGSEQPPGEKLLVVISSIGIVFAHASLAALVPLKAGQGWLRVGTVAAMLAGAVFFDLETVFGSGYRGSMLSRFAGAAAIVASCGSLALLIFARLNRDMVAPQDYKTIEEIKHLVIVCPRCGVRQKMAVGAAQCTQCGLKVRMEIGL